jgi:hypothetical protein
MLCTEGQRENLCGMREGAGAAAQRSSARPCFERLRARKIAGGMKQSHPT